MFNYLLQNDNKVVDQVFVAGWTLLDLLLEVIESTSHDTWIFVAE